MQRLKLTFLLVSIGALAIVGVSLAAGNSASKSKSATLAPLAAGTVNVPCPKGSALRSDGFKLASHVEELPGPRLQLTEMRAPSAGKLRGSSQNVGEKPGKVKITAYCGRSRKVKVKAKAKTLPAGLNISKPTALTVACSRGKIALLGGFRATRAGETYIGFQLAGIVRPSASKIRISGYGYQLGTPVRLKAFAYCGRGKAPKPVKKTVKFPTLFKRESATAHCRHHKRVVFGGFLGANKTATTASQYPAPVGMAEVKHGTAVKVTAIGGAGAKLIAIAYCK